MSNKKNNQIPEIMGFQLGSGGIGNLQKSVNLFRGDVNFTQNLLTLPGRSGKSELDVTVGIICQSNVNDSVGGRNLEEPTGILGVGWSLPLEMIVSETNGSASPMSNDYYYLSGETSNPLHRVQQDWLRLTMSLDLVKELDKPNVSTALQAQFALNGIAIALTATITQNQPGQGEWLISDKRNEHTYQVVKSQQLEVYDGGQAYELQNYESWKINYYPGFERWEIVKETGITSVYGGGISATAKGYKTGKGNSVEWGVKRGNWLGSSILIDNQEQYATTWHMSEMHDQWGDSIQYEYNGFDRNEQGIIEQVEQFVGDNSGKPYTKACYLTKIIDVFGRIVTFNYGDKEYHTDPELPREYQDPNKVLQNPVSPSKLPPNLDTPNAFQDKYETKFLDSINVFNTGGNELQFSIHFEYFPLKNLTKYTGPLKGNTFKRFLKSIIQCNETEDALPGFVFDYYWDDITTDINSGAVKTITYPEGGTAAYTYTRQELDICSRELPIKQPDQLPNGEPRIWFGNDYVVSVWEDNEAGKIMLNVFTWTGRWQAWKNDFFLISQKAFNDGSINVQTRDNFFVLYFYNNNESDIFLFYKDNRRIGQWVVANACNPYSYSPDAEFTAGDRFVIIGDRDSTSNDNQYMLQLFTWDWKKQDWTKSTPITGEKYPLQITTGRGFYLTMAYNDTDSKNSIVSLNYLDDLDNWHHDVSKQKVGVAFRLNEPDKRYFYWCSGNSLAAASIVSLDSSEVTFEYYLRVYQWDENYKFLDLDINKSDVFQQQLSECTPMPIPYVPQVINDNLIGSGTNLLRFNGHQWLVNKDALKEDMAYDHTSYWFAYGENFILKTVNDGKPKKRELLVYNPDQISTIWDTKARECPVPAGTPEYPLASFFPAASGSDYFSIGNLIFYRGNSLDWKEPFQTPLCTIEGDINTPGLINMAPQFIAYFTYNQEQGQSSDTRIITIKNGTVLGHEPLANQMIFTANPRYNSTPIQDIAGKIPVGPSAFVTYPAGGSGRFCDAKLITVYRYAGEGFQGTMVHYPVQQIDIFDGFQQHHYTYYEFDRKSAACDPSGKVVKYYQSTVYPGSDGVIPPSNKNGHLVNIYINGYNTDNLRADFYLNGKPALGNLDYHMLDGLLYKIETYDNNNTLLASTTNVWGIFTQRNSNPHTRDVTPIPLWGGYTKQHQARKMKDGVTSTMTNLYIPKGFDVPFSGMLLQQTIENYDGTGTKESLTTAHTYGYEKYDALLYLHQLVPVVQEQKFVQQEGQPMKFLRSSANTLKSWSPEGDELSPKRFVLFQTFHWTDSSVSPDFTFPPDYSTPQGWIKQSTVTAISSEGLVLETRDILQRTHSILYDKNRQYQVATFLNASLQGEEADYYGFEDYENPRGWEIGSGAEIIQGDAHTGKNSLKLSAQAAFQENFTPLAQQQDYVLACWYKTETGFQAKPGSGWQVIVSENGTPVGNPIFTPFQDTAGEWIFSNTIIDLTAYQQLKSNPDNKLTISLTASNTASQYVLLDNTRFSPYSCNFTANTYNQRFSLLTARIDMGKQTSRMAYDRFRRKVCTVGPYEENPEGLTCSFLSRQENSGVFSSSAPNHELVIKPCGGGYYEGFANGDQWQKHWTPSNPGDNWKVENGCLQHTNANQDDTLSLKETDVTTNFALYFALKSQHTSSLTINEPIGIKVGDSITLQWNPSTTAWSLTVNGTTVNPLANTADAAKEWLLILKEHTLFFCADGQLIFSFLTDQQLSGQPALFTGKNQVTYYNLAFMKDPDVNISFQDATGKKRQHQTLIPGNCIVSQTIYDEMGHPAVTTKPAPALFAATGQHTPLLAYRDSFVNVADFLTKLDNTGEMQGDVSDYYNGVNNPSNDELYPYHRHRLENSPLSRLIEEGAPGKEYAINLETTDPSKRNTIRYQYSNNSKDQFASILKLPAGQYYIQTRINQRQVPSKKLVDMMGNGIVKGTLSSEGIYQFSNNKTRYNSHGHVHTLFLPNYYDADVPGKAMFLITQQYNLLGRLTEQDHPDTGKKKMMYNKAGQLRFYQDANGEKQGYIVYIKYDILGRKIEKGICSVAWGESLQENAENPDWPSKETAPGIEFTTQNTWTYTGNGSDLNAIGRLTGLFSYNKRDTADVLINENFEYDDNGRVKTNTIIIRQDSTDTKTYSVGYQYTPTGKVSQVTYPESSVTGIDKVVYTYNEQGQMLQVGTQDSPGCYAKYTYGANGVLESKALNNNTIVNNLEFTPPGWIKAINNPQVTGFAENNMDYFYNGLIEQMTDTFSGSEATGNNFTVSYGYDNNDRLTNASFNIAGQSEMAASQTMEVNKYDANGNILSITRNTTVMPYIYYEGTNKVSQMECGGNLLIQYSYNSKGGVQTVTSPNGENRFTYEQGGNLTEKIEIPGGEFIYAYGGKGQRVLRQFWQNNKLCNSKIYIHGQHAYPLLEINQDNIIIPYIYGSDGLISFKKFNELYFVIKDREGSSRMVLDRGNSVIAAYDYWPFGQMRRAFEKIPGILTYLYTGQEFEYETELYNYRARFYDPALGRFYAPDPAGEYSSPYIYVGDNPIMWQDPSGEWNLFKSIGHFFKHCGEAIASTLIDATEVVAGGILTASGLGIFGNVLIGAGVSGFIYSVTSLANGGDFSWEQFGEQELIGAVGGILTGGVGLIGGGMVGALEECATRAITRTAISLIGKTVVGAASGAVSSFSSQEMSNTFSDDGVSNISWKGMLINAAAGGAGSLIGGGFGKPAGKAATIVNNNEETIGDLNGLSDGERRALQTSYLAHNEEALSLGERCPYEDPIMTYQKAIWRFNHYSRLENIFNNITGFSTPFSFNANKSFEHSLKWWGNS